LYCTQCQWENPAESEVQKVGQDKSDTEQLML